MKILVPIKRVADYNVKVRPNADESDVDLDNVKMSMNPFCEIAVEEAVRIKEKQSDVEIIVVSVGPSKAQEQLRSALAMGADRAIHVVTDASVEPLAISKVIKTIADKEVPDLIILGKQSIDGDNNQTGQMLSALLNLPQGTFASEVEVDSDSVNVTREVDGGLQTLKLKLPAIITTDLRLNEPRFVKLPDIMKAKKKPLEVVEIESLGLDISPRVKLLKAQLPPSRSAGVKVDSVDQLIEKLKNEAKVLA